MILPNLSSVARALGVLAAVRVVQTLTAPLYIAELEHLAAAFAHTRARRDAEVALALSGLAGALREAGPALTSVIVQTAHLAGALRAYFETNGHERQGMN